MRPARRRSRGHTLIEVSIAAGLLTFGALGLVPLLVTGNQGLTSSSMIIQATALADSKLTELVTMDYASTALAAGSYTEATNLSLTGVPLNPDGTATGAYGCGSSSDGRFARSWTIADVQVPTGSLNAKEIAVTVCWWDKISKSTHSVVSTGGVARPR